MTKRQLGILFIVSGSGAIAGLLLMDVVNAGQHQGIGPAQKQAMLAATLVILVGLTLLPLGDHPA